ncbi:LysR family transcriptional regulator [Erwinia sp.]|uniref:LysR family transcriptional regulator n=1 Tax=Erwinia citreus TaxID=558 RepID=UPI00289C73BF|nr:LysR family transcriptional regulator [Erwinia sp.]
MKTRATLQELEIFIAIARHLNFRKAAEERNVTPSTLSHTLSNLEQRTGVRLLSRTTRSVSLTEAGRAFLLRIEPAMLDLSLAVDELNDWRSDPRGTLRLNLPRSAEALYLRTLLLPFRQRYPDIALEVTTSDSFVNIVEGGFDAGVRFGEAIPQDMVAIPFGPKIRGAVVASPDFIARYGTPQHPRDLVNFSCIQHRFPSGVNYKWEFSDGGQALEIAVKGGLTLDSDAMMMTAALSSAGLAFVIKDMAQAQLESGELVEVLAHFAAPSAGFWLYYPGRKYYSTALRCFIEYLQAFNQKGCQG